MAKLNIPAGIEKAIKAGKVVLWAQKGANGKVLPRINGRAARFYEVQSLIRNHTRIFIFGTKPEEVYVDGKWLSVVPLEDLYIDVALYANEDGESSFDYEHGLKFNWFKGDLDHPMKPEHAYQQINGGWYDVCRFFEV